MIVSYITLSAGGTNWKIPTNKTSDSSMTKNMYITNITGLVEPGEASNDSTPRSYSHGSVLPPITYYRGKDISLGIAFVGGAQTAVDNFYELINKATVGYVTLGSSLGPKFTCKLVRVDEQESLKQNYIVAEFQFIAQEAF